MSADWDLDCINLALAEARKGPVDLPKIGAVIAVPGKIIAATHKDDNGHAESNALRMVRGRDLTNATVYVTLEPCVNTLSGCAHQLLVAGVRRVFLGAYDRNPKVHRMGWRALVEGGAVVLDFRNPQATQARQLVEDFLGHFERTASGQDGGKFDIEQNGGLYEFRSQDGNAVWKTSWTLADATSVYMYPQPTTSGLVAKITYATAFGQQDSLDALDFERHYVHLREGEFGVIRNDFGWAEIHVRKIERQPSPGDKHSIVHYRYRTRPRDRG